MKIAAQSPELKPFGSETPELKNAKSGKIKQLANEFESLFLEIVLKSMRETVGKSELVNGGNAEDIYRSMLDQEYAKNMAGMRQTGIGDAIEKQLSADSAGKIDTSALKSAKTGINEYHKAAYQSLNKPLK